MTSITQLDLRMLFWFAKIEQRPRWGRAGKLISKSGDGYLQIVIPLISSLASAAEYQQLAITCLYAFAIERPIYFILKNTLKRRRPPVAIASFSSAIVAADEFSFPSGHTCAAFLLACLCWHISLTLGIVLTLWAALVGCSRVLLGVHFPTDILAGASLGIVIGYCTMQFAL